jgi:hypothetical protein
MPEMESNPVPHVTEKAASFESVGVDWPGPDASTCTWFALPASVDAPIVMEPEIWDNPVAGIMAVTVPVISREPFRVFQNQYWKGKLGVPVTIPDSRSVTGHRAFAWVAPAMASCALVVACAAADEPKISATTRLLAKSLRKIGSSVIRDFE